MRLWGPRRAFFLLVCLLYGAHQSNAGVFGDPTKTVPPSTSSIFPHPSVPLTSLLKLPRPLATSAVFSLKNKTTPSPPLPPPRVPTERVARLFLAALAGAFAGAGVVDAVLVFAGRHRPGGLEAHAQLRDHGHAHLGALPVEVVEEAAALVHDGHEAAPGSVILRVKLEVGGQVLDALVGDRNLHLRRTHVVLVAFVFFRRRDHSLLIDEWQRGAELRHVDILELVVEVRHVQQQRLRGVIQQLRDVHVAIRGDFIIRK
mmetsp:Transcript_66673/g.150603  ORF Transcript_66673/g.150603 Transcript_66673/m.150603 type:complete len:259 (+) Transcript_66673:128-904(+)